MKVELEKVNCNFCGSGDYSFFSEQKDLIHKVNTRKYQVVSCNQCGLKFTNPRPTKDSISYFYSNQYSFHSSKSKINLFIKKILEIFAENIFIKNISWLFPKQINQILIKFLKPKISDPVLEYINQNTNNMRNLKFLDIGCGSGLTTNFWGSKSSLIKLSKILEVYGVEPSSDARKVLQENKIKSFANLQELDSKDKFHIIRLNWSLEHVHSPSEYFSFIENSLLNNGIAVICVPNIKGILYRINKSALELPVHLFHFDINSLTNYSEKFNLTIKKFLTFSYPEMYLFAEKIGLINDQYNFKNLNLIKASNLLEFHKIFDDLGYGNDILLVLKKSYLK